jgi:phosphoribosylamine--glycine ligase
VKVLLVGSGGREHALADSLRASPSVSELFAAPGNAGIAQIARIVPISPASVVELADFAAAEDIGLTVVGPELPLSLSIVDEFQKRGRRIFGPTRVAAEIEISKAFAKDLCRRQGIPTPRAWACATRAEAEKALKETGFPAMVKADGLAAGKGVMPVHSKVEARKVLDLFFEERVFGQAGDRVLIEEFLTGQEASFLALCDGKIALPLPTAKDYKKIFEGDRGPNTGGMGAHSPSGVLDAEAATFVLRKIIYPALSGLSAAGREFRGVLYAGLMITREGPNVLEFNARFGDPETEAILPRLNSDLVPALLGCAEGNLSGIELFWKHEACATVILASAGYPGTYSTGMPIHGIPEAEALPGVRVYHAATSIRDGQLVTSGGRVLAVTASAPNLSEAISRAYAAADRISFEGKTLRRDIGSRVVSVDSTESVPIKKPPR